MIRYVIKRLLILIPVLLGVAFIVFLIMSLTPSSPGRIILGVNASQEAVDQLDVQFGYNRPFFIKFADYVVKAVTGDFGNSYLTQQPVFTEIIQKFPTTFTLALAGIFITVIVGIPIGVLSAIKQYSKIDFSATVLAMLMAAVPGFWLGMLLIILFSLKLRVLPSFGIGSWKHYILPAVTLALPSAASVMRMTRSTMLETIREDYIRTARAKGATEKRVIWRHAFRNALLPIITLIAVNFGGLLGSTILIEKVFGMPGIGLLMVNAISAKDVPVVMGCAIFLAMLFCLILLAVDLMYSFIDPRIKDQFSK